MFVFQIFSKTLQFPDPLKQRNRRKYTLLQHFARVILLSTVITLLFLTHLFILFILFLPLSVSLVASRSQFFKLLHGTLLYSILTEGLALLYFGCIMTIQVFIHTPGFGILFFYHGPAISLFIVVATTLTWVVLLRPLYTAAQAFIDQRFDRRNYEAARAIEAFTSTLREEIELDKIRNGLLTVVQQTMQSVMISLWIQKPSLLEAECASPSEWSAPNVLPSETAIAKNDPFLLYVRQRSGAIDVKRLHMDSVFLEMLQMAQVEMVVPLTSQGKLLGLLTLNSRVNKEQYTHADRTLLHTLAIQVAPALRVAQLVEEQQTQVRERERIEQELRTAQNIQRTFLPKDIPVLPGWQIVSYYQPASEVGGDFYDFLPLADGRLGLVIGDVTDKGIPAALVMTATRTMIRTAVQEKASPAEVLAQVNDLLYEDIPASMFVTCFYAILDPRNGRLCYANAGHEAPYRHYHGEAAELWATGMPLGMLPGTHYEEYETLLEPGETLLLYSDGLVEAHNPAQELFGFPRLQSLLKSYSAAEPPINYLLGELRQFTGQKWEQEDDITLVVLQRMSTTARFPHENLLDLSLPSLPGNEREAMERVAESIIPLHLSPQRVADLKTAVAESTMNAMEHGNHYQSDKMVGLQVSASEEAITVRIIDESDSETPLDLETLAVPDLTAKLDGLQTPRGWGLFLIKHLVDELHISREQEHQVIELIMLRH